VVQEELDDAPHEARIDDFWAGFRELGLRSSLLTALDLAGLIVIVVALNFYGRSDREPLRWLSGPIGLIGLVWLAAQLYVRTDRPWEIVREALLLTIGYPLSTFSLLLTSIVLLVAAVALAGPVLFVVFSAMAMLQTVALRHVLLQRAEIGQTTP
jgi:hypothetical protein